MTGHLGDHLRTPPPVWDVLQDKILVHTRTSDGVRADLARMGKTHDGLTLCAKDAIQIARSFNAHSAGEPLQLVDPEAYEEYATIEEPFRPDHICEPGQLSFLDDEDAGKIQGLLDAQLRSGAAAALTPTRYIKAGKRDIVAAVVDVAGELDVERTILAVPLDHGWLRSDEDIDWLIEELSQLPHIKAITLGAIYNPLQLKGTATALRKLIRGLERVALIRTDLAGLDAYAHGALFASIGMQTPLRRIRTPGATPSKNRERRAVTTTVLHPQLLRYFNADTLHDLYGDTEPPACECAECQGESLTRSQHENRAHQEAANRHNIATWLPWAQELQRAAPGQARYAAWQELCWNAVEAHRTLREKLSAPGELEVPRWLSEWIQEPGQNLPAH
ncbi:hypothetical protein ABII15_36185 [Streptomyces sp. HUAS MG91]|uniref:tRNA-guanine(15) transglycosylase-like domain-containing protein n=1 Tax=Streptomyces tabacisoli TaxID=3156398 RepID=A0AAU8J3M5_9ACTN